MAPHGGYSRANPERTLMKSSIRTLAIAVVGATTIVLSVSAAGADKKQGDRYRVTTTADTVDVAPGDGRCADADGECSLRAAVQEANATPGTDNIRLSKKTYTLTMGDTGDDSAASGDLDITDSIHIDGKGASIDLAELGDRAFDISSNTTASIDRLSIINGAPPEGESGGAVRNAGTLTLDRVTASGNTVAGAGASGGAVFNNSTLTVVKSDLSGNSATRAGGAIEANGGTTIVDRSTMNDNTAGDMPGNGGALHLTGAGYVEVTRTTVDGNVAASEGGGLWNSAVGTMVISNSTITDNAANGVEADNGGGGLFNDGNDDDGGGTMTVAKTTVTGNTATMGSGSGGGIFNGNGALSVSKSTISGNEAARAGGAIETVNGITSVTKSELTGNTAGSAPGNGGGMHVSGGAAIVSIDQTVVADNVAALEGGGLWAGAGGSIMTVTSSTISGNVANGTDAINGGGGLFNKGGELIVANSSITDNQADMGSGSGGGTLNLGTLDVRNTVIDGNSSARAGGGIESNEVNGAGDTTLSWVTLTNNSTGPAPGNGGGMHVTGSSITTVIDSSTVTGNSAAKEGGGLWNFNGATMTVYDTVIVDNTAPVAPNVFQNGAGGDFTVDGELIPPGDNSLAFP